MKPTWEPIKTPTVRPVAVVGAGVLGRRIGIYRTSNLMMALLANATTQAVSGRPEVSKSSYTTPT